MQFTSFTDFLNMGGYGFFVWLSFGVSGALLVLLMLSTKFSHQNIRADIAKQIKREAKLQKAAELSKIPQEVSDEP